MPAPRPYDTSLACTTAGRLRRMSTHAEDDLANGGTISVEAAQAILQAAADLQVEALKISAAEDVAARKPAA